MIDISFLRAPPKLTLSSGLEFLDWQDNSFFQEMSKALTDCYDEKTRLFTIDKIDKDALSAVIKKHTNLTTTIVPMKEGNLAIDAGFISPNNILNMPGLDQWANKKFTKFAEAFKSLKQNVIRGYCDLNTGKVEGDFTKINFNIYINVNIVPSYGIDKKIGKYSATIPEAIAAGVLHECGHAFFGLHYASSHVIDNALISQAVKLLADEPDKNRRAVIIKDLRKETDIRVDTEFVADVTDPGEIFILFGKGLKNRDYRRSLSLGVSTMSMEVFADAYAIRMGASHGLSALLATFASNTALTTLIIFAGSFAAVAFFAPISAALGVALYATLSYTLGVMDEELVHTIYDTPYRRLKNVLRENIAHLNSQSKVIPRAELNKVLAQLKELDRIAEENKPLLESTAIQRLMGWMTSGSDFRKTDFEHYTAELTNSSLALHINLFDKD